MYQYPDSASPASSGGTFQVGFVPSGTVPPRTQYIANPDGNNCLIIENRYSGPLGVQWATSGQQIGAGLIGQGMAPYFHVPRLRRVVMPWPKEYGFNVLYRSQLLGATLFDTANTTEAIPNGWSYQRTSVRYWWVTIDSPEWYSESLYPTEDRIILGRTANLNQGTKVLHHVLPFSQTGFPFTNVSLVLAPGDNPRTPPDSLSQDARIMRVQCAVRGGSATALLTDLEFTAVQELANLGGSTGQASSTRPFGSTAAVTTEHQPTPWIEIPGSVGVVWDCDSAPAATNIVFDAWYEVAIPLD